MRNETVEIRNATDADWGDIWRIIEPVFRAGETYAFATDISEADARDAWYCKPERTLVAEESGSVVGTYYIKPNQSGLGAHVCNCGYIVDAAHQGQGIASLMCEHSQQTAIELGFRAMQYNLVVSTNQRAVQLWKRYGFTIVGTLPGAFRHSTVGFVDAFIMFKTLDAGGDL